MCNLTSCNNKPSAIPNQKISVSEKMLNTTPDKPENLNTITCLDCRIEIEDYNITTFFKNPKSINFDISSIYDEEGEKYYGFKYDLGKNHQAVVFGHDSHEGGIDFYLVVWDNKKMQFTSEPQIISGMRGGDGQYEYIETTITDIDNDNLPDLITNYYTVYNNLYVPKLENQILKIYLFQNGSFEMKQGTAEQINKYRTQSFSLQERTSKDKIEDMSMDELEEFCHDTYDQLECLQQVYDEFNRRLSRQEQQFQSKNKKSYKDIQNKWLRYKSKEFKFIELIFDQDGTMYPKLTENYKTQIVKNRILEIETSDDIKKIDALKRQLTDAKTNYNKSYNNVVERFKILDHFESDFLSAHSTWLEYKKQAILPLDDETESSALNRHIILLNNRMEYLTMLNNYLINNE